MCDCIKEINEKIFDHINEKKAENEIIEKSTGLSNTSFILPEKKGKTIGEGMFLGTHQPFQYYYTRIKKDGTNGRRVTKSVQINHRYCPFCGKEYPQTN